MSQPHGESFYGNLGHPSRTPVPDPPQEHSDGVHAVLRDAGGFRTFRDDHGGGGSHTQSREPDTGAEDFGGQGNDDRWLWSRSQQNWWGYSWGNGSQWDSSWEPRWDSTRRWSRDETWGTGSTESGSATGGQGNGSQREFRQHGDENSEPAPPRDQKGIWAGSAWENHPDGWKPTALPPDLGGARPRSLPEGARGPSEKMAERLSVDRLAETAGVDYLIAWVKDRYLDVEITQVGRCLSDFFRKLRRKPGQSVRDYLSDFDRCLARLNEVGCVLPDLLSDFFRKLRRKPGQSVRDYLSDFDRCLARLNEVGCVLPDLASAWVLVDRMGLEESAELNLLASVGNVYNLKALQQASIVQDRSLRKPWEAPGGAKPWNTRRQQTAMMAGILDEENSDDCRGNPNGEDDDTEAVPESIAARRQQTAMMAGILDEENSDDCRGNPNGEDDDTEAVPESIAAELYEAYVTHETARQKYRDSLKLRGSDPEGMREAMHQKLQADSLKLRGSDPEGMREAMHQKLQAAKQRKGTFSWEWILNGCYFRL
eukprot:s1351_g9.t1